MILKSLALVAVTILMFYLIVFKNLFILGEPQAQRTSCSPYTENLISAHKCALLRAVACLSL